jgi:hypothetical protein
MAAVLGARSAFTEVSARQGNEHDLSQDGPQLHAGGGQVLGEAAEAVLSVG